jgi:hypothetical protein
LRDPAQLYKVLGSLGDHSRRLLFFADCSKAIGGAFRLHASVGAFFPADVRLKLESETRLSFVKSLYDVFRAASEDPPPFISLTDSPGALDPSRLAPGAPFTAAHLPACLSSSGTERPLVLICIAGEDTLARRQVQEASPWPLEEPAMRRLLTRHYSRAFSAWGIELQAALIVDLSGGRGDALPLALALAETQAGAIAYWDPQSSGR